MALGASRQDVLRLILGHGMTLTISGVVIGLLIALIATRVMVSLLFEVSAIDPMTFAGVALFLTFVALLACYIPTQRAIKIDPLTAIREQ